MTNKEFILNINFGIESNYFVRIINDSGAWEEIHNPRMATIFPSKKKAMDWAKMNSTLSKYMEAVQVSEQCNQLFDNWVANGMVRRQFNPINRSISRKFNSEKDTPVDVLNWWFDYYNVADDVLFEDYKTWPKPYQLFEHLWDVETYIDRKSNKKSFSVQLSTGQKNDFSNFKKEFDLVVDKVTYKNKDGYKVFHIMENDLSETRSPVLYFKNEKDCYIEDSRFDDRYINGTLEDCFNYMRYNLYYSS